MDTLGWLMIIAGIYLLRENFKGRLFDATGRFVLVDRLTRTFVALVNNDNTALKELDTEPSASLNEPIQPPSDTNDFGTGGFSNSMDNGRTDTSSMGNGPSRTYTSIGPVKSHVRLAANEIGSKFGIKTIYGTQGTQDHPKGLALDFMINNVDNGKAVGNGIAAYAKNDATRLKVQYVIWNGRIWNIDRNAEGWRSYSGTSNPHTDHVHISFKP